VQPPFYGTWWFYTLVGAIFLTVLHGAFRYRNWRFDREKAIREEFACRLLKAQESEFSFGFRCQRLYFEGFGHHGNR
jgi:hypothetical protein